MAVQGGDEADIAKYSKRTVRVTSQHNDECKRLLKLMGVPIVEVWSPHPGPKGSLPGSPPGFPPPSTTHLYGKDADPQVSNHAPFLSHIFPPNVSQRNAPQKSPF